MFTGINRPSGRNTSYTYSNKRVTETTGGKSKWKETDSQGLVTKSHDNGGDILYEYFPDGKVKTITAPGGVVTTMEYNDAARNQTKLIDPSAGTIEYTYNAFGQLKTQKNARNQTTTYDYHADGRISSKVSPEGTTSYTYNSNKQLTGISSPDGITRTIGYDSKGRVNSVSENIDGSDFSTTFAYDSQGRLSTRTHPSGITETNNYNSSGYLASITAGGETRYQVMDMNARQQITSAKYGASLAGEFGFDDYGYPEYSKARAGVVNIQDYRYSFNSVTGNLSSRQNYLRGKTESFGYDNLDRLLTVTGPQNLIVYYDTKGNIIGKSDAGVVFAYDHPDKPYALTGIEGFTDAVSTETQSVSYTSFELVSSIEEGNYHAAFTYNSDNRRCKMVVTELGYTLLTRWYINDRYIKESEGGVTREYTWIGGDAYSAPAVAVKQGADITWYYLLRDYLGNITHVVNTSNSVAAEYSYDAWGRRRDKDDWGYILNGEPELIAGRGFASHEYLPWFTLVNMNGRLYDPVTGRFLSPDNFVQLPDFTQNFNRYSYALNNPLIYTDPSGEFIFTLLATLIPGAQFLLPLTISTDIGWMTGGMNSVANGGTFWEGAWKGAVTGAISGATSYIGVPGIIPGGLIQSGASVGVNGITNLLNGDEFFDNWGMAAISGFASGAYNGYKLSDAEGLNYWWGTKSENWGRNRSQWSLAWWDKPTIYEGNNYQCSPYDNGFCVHSIMEEISKGTSTPLDQFYWMNISEELGSENIGVSTKVLNEYLNAHPNISSELFPVNLYDNCNAEIVGKNLIIRNNHILYIEPRHGALIEKVNIWERSGRFKIFIDSSSGKYVGPITNRNFTKRDFPPFFYLITTIQ